MKPRSIRGHGRARHAIAAAAALLANALLADATLAAATQLYASPTGAASGNCAISAPCSLEGARAKARTLTANMTGNVIVNLRAGTYARSSTFQLDQNDSGSNGFSVIYRSHPGETAVISGGTPITGWTQHDATNNIWKAPVGTLVFRQIYVNGTRAIRARFPNRTDADTNAPYLRAISPVFKAPVNGVYPKQPFIVESNVFGNWSKLNEVEVVWGSHWMHRHTRIASHSTSNGQTTLTFQQPEAASNFLDVPQNGTPFFFENSYDLLDAEGEWYLDRAQQTLYYKPRASENLATAEVIVPRVQTLIELAGTPTAPIHHVQVQGLVLRHTNWTSPSQVGYVNRQAGIMVPHDTAYVPGALAVRNADNVAIEKNTIHATGAHGLLLTGVLSNYRVVGNTLTDLAGGGIYEVAAGFEDWSATASSQSTNALISGNHVHHIGRIYSDVVGILATTPNHMAIEFNEISHAPYTGISLGWRWNQADIGTHHNRVENNRIHRVMQLRDDGGGIYTLGRMDDTVFTGNHVSDLVASPFVGGWPIAGIYLDNGSTGKTVTGNVLDSTIEAFYGNNCGKTPDTCSSGNTYTGNHYRNAALGRILSTNTVTGNTEVPPGAPWPAPVVSIIGGAGLVVNEAVNKVASAQASWPNYLPAYAVDGGTDENGWSAPDGAQRYWWEVDLGTSKRIRKIEIVSRLGAASLDNPPSRRNFEVWASNQAAMTPGNYVKLASVGVNGYPFRGTWSVVINDPLPYRYIAIVKTVPEYFYLNEVRVFR